MAMARPPPQMQFEGTDDKTEKFELWKQRINLYSLTNNKTGEALVPHLLQALDDEGLKIYNSFNLSADDKKLPEKIFQKFEERLKIHKTNFRTARLDLHFFYQQSEETVDAFYTRCCDKTKYCDFSADEVKERFIEQLLASTPIEDFRKWLLDQTKTVTMEEVLKEGRNHEVKERSMKRLLERPTQHAQQQQSVDAIQKHRDDRRQHRRHDKRCTRCNREHQTGIQNCPAKDSECGFCQYTGHWEVCCRKKQRSYQDQETEKHKDTKPKKYTPRRKVHGVRLNDDVDDESSNFEELEYSMIHITVSDLCTQNGDRADEAYGRVEVHLPRRKQKSFLKLKVDTGAQGNTMPSRTFRAMFPNNVDKDGNPTSITPSNNTRLTAYNGTPIKCFGSIKLTCRHKDSWISDTFYVVDVTGPAICGLPLSQKLGLVTMHCTVDKDEGPTNISSVEDLKKVYPEQFDRIGNLPGKVKLYLKENAEPFIDPPRKYSIHLRPKLKKELDMMEKQNVIVRVNEHCDWCSSLATSVKKDGSLRICLDPKKLNNNLRRCPHKVLTMEEISHKFSGANYFSKLDAKSGYWGCALDEESQKLTTFRTPFGRYKFQKMPFGLNVSQDIFQQKIDQILENCVGAVGIADDIAVYGRTEKEHDKNLMTLMKEAEQNGLVFNSNKCQIKKKEISYFGVTLCAQGIKPDPQKVEDLHSMPTPTSKTELQEFMGLITYLGPFIRALSAKAEPLRQLLKKDTPFEWSEDHAATYGTLKSLISKDECLKYYNTEAPAFLMVDASQKGLGAALLQPQKLPGGGYNSSIDQLYPVAFASKALTSAEKNYVNIEREMLAVTFGIKRLHTYLYGRHFTVLSDHKPLEMICSKPLTSAPPRLQAMLLATQGYDYKVKYIPGKEIGIADALSRLPNPVVKDEIDIDVRVEHLNFTTSLVDQIQQLTTSDQTLNEVKEVIYQGWPENQKELPTVLRNFWSYRDELSVDNGMILKGERLFIPSALRKKVLQNLHTGHLGITKTQLRARNDVFWPTINKDIELMCRACNICQEHLPSQQHQPLQPTEIPSRPWSVLGTDLFQVGNDQYIIIADYYSKFPLVNKLPAHASSKAVADITAAHLSVMGIPDIIRSDNGPQFIGQAYQSFLSEWNITHITSSPRYPRSNGFIERHIKTVKAIIKKARKAKENEDLALLRWRTTPVSNTLPSPAELLFGRRIKDTLPAKINNSWVNRDDIKTELQQRQEDQKKYHDTKARLLRPLHTGQTVTHKDHSTGMWRPAVVVAKAKEPSSYDIQPENGQELRRNREQIREVAENLETPAVQESEKINNHDNSGGNTVNTSGDSLVTRTRSGRAVIRPTRYEN